MKHRIVKGNFYGISKVKYVPHGEWADPEVIYRGRSFNYWEVENTLWSWFLDDKCIRDYKGDGEEFNEEFAQWIFDNQADVHMLLDEWIYGDSYNKKVS